HPPEPSWDHPVKVAVSQPLLPPTMDQALPVSFLITDFGSTQIVDHQVTLHISTETLRAPEVMQCQWDSKVNIWMFDCLACPLSLFHSAF
ncbi:hypothetical protein B0H10DRAFT_1672734, partial [Mycena sp. CBHHK59/15]